MELKILTEKILDLFNCSLDDIGSTLFASLKNEEKMKGFKELVGNDLSKDWLQMIYQYRFADRKEKKQDFTPLSIAQFMGELVGEQEEIVDMCAGSGSLIIQKWAVAPDIKFTAIEIDENVIPFLLFNMVVRNIRCKVYQMDVLADSEPYRKWEVLKGEEFGYIVDFKSPV